MIDKQTQAKMLIDELGGTTQVARICQIAPPSVSGWKTHGVPLGWQKYLSIMYPRLTVWTLPVKRDKA